LLLPALFPYYYVKSNFRPPELNSVAGPAWLEFSNQDDVLHIVRLMQAKPLFSNAEEAAQFALGLKLFSEVLLKHRTKSLFAELAPAFGEFMKKLKES
jgi:hypothetical protein